MRAARRRMLLAVLGLALVSTMTSLVVWAAEKPTVAERREKFTKAFKDGNYKTAYDGLRALVLDKANDPKAVGGDLHLAIDALNNLGRHDEIDELRESAVALHADNWRLLHAAANSLDRTQGYGFIVAGKFHRGWRREGGRYVNSWHRDRIRALQLMKQGMPLAVKDTEAKPEVARFFLDFARKTLQATENHRLHALSDLAKLPDYEDGYRYGREHRGAAVDENNKPIYHTTPKAWDKAESDGQRWRWLLTQAAEYDSALAGDADMDLASFCRENYGVQTMAYGGWRATNTASDDKKTGTFDLRSLSDEETIAKLATGIQRFKLPDEFNPLKIWERVAARGKSGNGGNARDLIAREYEDRRQYPKAAEAWKKAIAEYGNGTNDYRKHALDQIVGNWGRFEHIGTQPAGKRAQVDFRFRNGEKVEFTAHAIKLEELFTDTKAYLKNAKPRAVDWNKANIGDIGWRLVERDETKYLGEKVAEWSKELKPRPHHIDSRVTVVTPIDKPGVYLVTAKMAKGNVSKIVVWVADTVLVKKQLDNKVLWYAADAVTGAPIEKANVEFFGWKTRWNRDGNDGTIETTSFARSTDGDGQVVLGSADMAQDHSWLVVARKPKDGVAGADRLAFLGFNGVGFGRVHDPDYNATRVFTMTDRPVYRPEHTVKFKSWIRHSKYDQKDVSDFANRQFNVVIRNPKGDKVFEKALTTDEFGGLEGELKLPKDTTLGVYNIRIDDNWRWQQNGNFRVEEYKKPEFEVKVEAPKEPIRLGETIEATVLAKYYFGAPVTKAKVKVKVTRTSHSTDWYPVGKWDWCYGPGYWWFAADYDWYPGFAEWGCRRPVPHWWRGQRHEPPEVVSENETEIGPDGTVKVSIDTRVAKELYGDKEDHKYSITAEVVDESRRTIVGSGDVVVSHKPFEVHSWVDRGWYRVGDTVKASFRGLTPDRKAVVGKGVLTLNRIAYKDGKPVETVEQTWNNVETDTEGYARQSIKAAKAGQYRLSYKLTDAKKNTIEGGYVFVIRGDGVEGNDFRFNGLELVSDKPEYAPGDKVNLLVNTDNINGTVLLFLRPTNGVYLAPKTIRLKGKSAVEAIDVVQKDMPNFFVEALTVHGGRVHTETREIVVPPEKRILNVAVTPSKTEYKPGEKATVKVKVTDLQGNPFVGSTVLTVYDRSVEYISGGSNVGDIKEYFWKWRRHHYPSTEESLARYGRNLHKGNERGMADLGLFGRGIVEEESVNDAVGLGGAGLAFNGAPGKPTGGFGGGKGESYARGANLRKDAADRDKQAEAREGGKPGEGGDPAGGENPMGGGGVVPTIRKNFADTALWRGGITTDKDGLAEVTFDLPEQTTGWKIRVWAMGHGTKVGQGESEVFTKKDLLLRLQAPRFFTQKDEVTLSANVHNYLKKEKDVTVTLEVEGGTLSIDGSATQKVTIASGGEKRVDWRVKVTNEGVATVRMKAVTDEDSDAMQMTFPAYVHGMLKMESFSGVIRPAGKEGKITINVPKERKPEQSRLVVQYSPSLAGAMVDALPYLAEYPYGCTEQTLNRFLPTVITQRTLQRMKLDLKDIKEKRTNLNAAELGKAADRAAQWKRYDRNPVFDEAEVGRMAIAGVTALTNMQCSDGGWGWFSGFGERSYPHTTAVVVHGLQLAKENDIALVPNVLERGVDWLRNWQTRQVQELKNAPTKTMPYKEHADNTDALVYMVLCDAGVSNAEMRDFLYRDRTKLTVYAKAMFGLALHKEKETKKLEMILENIKQFLVEDAENQTAYLKLPAGNAWWYWYGSEVESNAWYLKLLAKTDPKGDATAGLVKYLLNNRKHATYWSSTRDTAYCIEAMADYLKGSGEDKPDMTVEVWYDGKLKKEVTIDAKNLFSFDNKFYLEGDAVESGTHTIEIKRKGTGPVYFNAYLTNFTMEDFITKAGLEVKVNRKYYKLERVADASDKAPDKRGKPVDRKIEKYKRVEIKSGETLKSGDLVEVELEIDSKNDYEYLLFEDPRAAGFEPMAVRSGYNGNDMGAYMEVRDDRVCFFARTLARGKHSVSYRMRAEIPGKFSALPARGEAMYAPELKGNSDEIKLGVTD